MRRYVGLLALVIVVAGARIAAAQVEVDGAGSGSASAGSGAGSAATTPPKDPKLAKQLVGAAQQLVARGNALAKSKPDDAKEAYTNAVTAYQSAIDNSDDINLYLPLGQVQEKLGALADAYKSYQKVVTATAGAQPAIVKQAKARVDDLATKVGIVTLTITPDDTTVQIDHVDVGVSPLKEPLVLMPGTYTLSLAAVSGFQPKELQLQIDPGSETERKLELEPIPVVVTHVKQEQPQPPAPPRAPPSKLPLLVGAGATGVFALTTVISGLVAVHDHSTFVARGSSAQERFDAKINGQHAAEVSDVFFGATIAAAGFTACWYFWKYRQGPEKASDDSHNPSAPKLDMGPWVQPDGGGIAAWGAF